MLCLTLAFRGAAAEKAVLGQDAVFRAGGYEVSSYLFTKYFGRYLESVHSREHRRATVAEAAAWRDKFVCAQVVTAHLIGLGYRERREVVETVAHMQTVMLTQAAGPFYDALAAAAPPISAAEWRSIAKAARTPINARIALFRSGTSTSELLGADFGIRPADQQTARIERCLGSAGVALTDARLFWPYLPYSEVGDLLQTAPLNLWVRHTEPGWGEYFVLVRTRGDPPSDMAPIATGNADFALRLNYNESLRRTRMLRLLPAAQFHYDAAVGAFLAGWCWKQPPVRGRIVALPAAIIDQPLFEYRLDGRRIVVTTDGFRRHYNEQYIRTPLRSAEDLRSESEKMALEGLDYQEAIRRGIDRTYQFQQDKLGFTRLQILDLYERESLALNIHVSEEQVHQYFADHRRDYPGTAGMLEVAPDIRRTLLRQALDQKERALASDLGRLMAVKVSLPDLNLEDTAALAIKIN